MVTRGEAHRGTEEGAERLPELRDKLGSFFRNNVPGETIVRDQWFQGVQNMYG